MKMKQKICQQGKQTVTTKKELRKGREVFKRQDAIAQGLKRYYTGRICPNGHYAERFVSNFGCTECLRNAPEYGIREWRLMKSKEYNAKQKETDPKYYIKKIYRERKRHAERSGIPFTITFDDLPPVPEYCPVLGIPIKHGTGDIENSPSLDKIVPRLGYIPGNIAWISGRANAIKRDAALEELEMLVRWLTRMRDKQDV